MARSLLFYLVFYGATVVLVLVAMLVLALSPRRLPGLVHLWSRLHRGCLRTLVGIDVRETGSRVAGPALYAFRHESFFEAIDLPMVLERPAVFAKQELFALPGWGRAAHAYGLVPVARGEGARALRSMIAGGRKAAGSGRPLVIFPEGTRVPHGARVPLQAGFAALYKALGLPVVPVAVNSGPLYHRWRKLPGTITLHFGEPIEPGLPRAEIEARVLAAINALNR